MLRYILFEDMDWTRSYIFPNGRLVTRDIILEKNPAAEFLPYVLELNGPVIQAVMQFDAVRNFHKIDSELSNEDAIAQIEYLVNNHPEPEPSAEERIAAALEFQNIMLLPDIE